MKKASGLYSRLRWIAGALALVAMLTAGLSMDAFTIVSRADSAGKITASSAKVRKEASTSSEAVASVKKGDTVTVKGQTQGSDGNVWYHVDYNDGQTGYIRSDLMEITDGSTPGTIVPATTGQSTGSTSNTSAPDEAVAAVTEVQPVSAKVKGSSPVRVRQNASTTSRIVSTAQGGLAMTVNGTADGTDGNQWYRVSFIANGSEISGFIRADYVTLDGELIAAGGETTEPQTEQPEKQPAENTGSGLDSSKDWDTFYQDEVWHLVDNTTGKSYSIDQIFETVETNNKTLKEVLKTNQTQQIVVVALVILAVILVLVISILAFKLKEIKDAAYYEKIERETARKRAAASANGTKPAGSRSAGQRPNGANGTAKKPAGSRPAGQRPGSANGGTKRPAGSRPDGQRPNTQRPTEKRAGGPQPDAAERKEQALNREEVQGQKAEAFQEGLNEDVEETIEKPKGSFTENIEEAAKEMAKEMEQGKEPAEQAPAAPAGKQKWKSKNFADDDEFEFQFLDWDENQE